MYLKSLFKNPFNLFLTSTCIGIASNLIATEPLIANSCPANPNAAIMSQDCFTTPEEMDIKFYELGFCTGDPLAAADFSSATCTKAWDFGTGETLDLAEFNYKGLRSGLTYKLPNGQYDYAYVIFDPVWGLKGKVYFNSDTYYTDVNGNVTTVENNYAKFNMRVNNLTNGACNTYSSNTDYGPVKARITDDNLATVATNACNNATRMVGSINLNTPLLMTNDVKAYQLTWIIRDMGLMAVDDAGSNNPVGWGGGPFIPSFTLSK